MFNVGGGEFLVILLVALIVVGPEQLPGLLRKAGRYAAQIKAMGDNVRTEFMAGAEEMDPRNWADDDPPRRGKGTPDDPILPRSTSRPAPSETADPEPDPPVSGNSVAQANASASIRARSAVSEETDPTGVTPPAEEPDGTPPGSEDDDPVMHERPGDETAESTDP